MKKKMGFFLIGNENSNIIYVVIKFMVPITHYAFV